MVFELDVISFSYCLKHIDENDELCLKDINSNCFGEFFFVSIEKVKEFYKKYENPEMRCRLVFQLPKFDTHPEIMDIENIDSPKQKFIKFLEKNITAKRVGIYFIKESGREISTRIEFFISSLESIDKKYNLYLDYCDQIKNI